MLGGNSSVYEVGCFAVIYLCFVDCSCVCGWVYCCLFATRWFEFVWVCLIGWLASVHSSLRCGCIWVGLLIVAFVCVGVIVVSVACWLLGCFVTVV